MRNKMNMTEHFFMISFLWLWIVGTFPIPEQISDSGLIVMISAFIVSLGCDIVKGRL